MDATKWGEAGVHDEHVLEAADRNMRRMQRLDAARTLIDVAFWAVCGLLAARFALDAYAVQDAGPVLIAVTALTEPLLLPFRVLVSAALMGEEPLLMVGLLAFLSFILLHQLLRGTIRTAQEGASYHLPY